MIQEKHVHDLCILVLSLSTSQHIISIERLKSHYFGLWSGGQGLKYMFTPEELQLLDSYPEGDDEPEEEEQEKFGAAPDLENLDVPAKAQNDEKKDSLTF